MRRKLFSDDTFSLFLEILLIFDVKYMDFHRHHKQPVDKFPFFPCKRTFVTGRYVLQSKVDNCFTTLKRKSGFVKHHTTKSVEKTFQVNNYQAIDVSFYGFLNTSFQFCHQPCLFGILEEKLKNSQRILLIPASLTGFPFGKVEYRFQLPLI